MNYPLIIYLIGVLINIYFGIDMLKFKYNNEKVVTIGDILGHIIICLTSWLSILLVLIGWLGMHIESIVNKPLFKNIDNENKRIKNTSTRRL